QAEDGIRDWSVTGVQTCALPISALRGPGGRAPRPAHGRPPDRDGAGRTRSPDGGRRAQCLAVNTPRNSTGRLPRAPPSSVRPVRSEERRVGKEGGPRGGAGATKR